MSPKRDLRSECPRITHSMPMSLSWTGLPHRFSPPLRKANEVGTPDLAGERTRVLKIDVLCCNFDAILCELVQREDVEGRGCDYDLCGGRVQSIGLVHTYE